MRWKRLSLALCAVTTLLTGPATAGSGKHHGPQAEVVKRGLIACFTPSPQARRHPKGTCEPSSVLVIGQRVTIGNERLLPGRPHSMIMRFSLDALRRATAPVTPRYIASPQLDKTQKLEDFSLAPDGRWAFANTSFNRIRADGSWDRFNKLLYWPAGAPERARYFPASVRDVTQKRIPLRQRISRALASAEYPHGTPYFKIEGLAAIPGRRLLLGVRCIGASYKAYTYGIWILSMSYREQAGRLVLNDDLKRVYVFSHRAMQRVGRRVGLSSLEYDRFNRRLVLLTSYEESDTARGIGAYLWTLTLGALRRNEPAQLVVGPDNRPLLFAHKAEGVSVIDKDHLLVVHDDDRVTGTRRINDPRTQFYRPHHQAAYEILRWRR